MRKQKEHLCDRLSRWLDTETGSRTDNPVWDSLVLSFFFFFFQVVPGFKRVSMHGEDPGIHTPSKWLVPMRKAWAGPSNHQNVDVRGIKLSY